jgi:hypothetical protein
MLVLYFKAYMPHNPPRRTTSDNSHGINKFWIGNSGKVNEVDITMKVKRGDYFNSPQDSIHKFQNKPEESISKVRTIKILV